jgi:hypothetical protein
MSDADNQRIVDNRRSLLTVSEEEALTARLEAAERTINRILARDPIAPIGNGDMMDLGWVLMESRTVETVRADTAEAKVSSLIDAARKLDNAIGFAEARAVAAEAKLAALVSTRRAEVEAGVRLALAEAPLLRQGYLDASVERIVDNTLRAARGET